MPHTRVTAGLERPRHSERRADARAISQIPAAAFSAAYMEGRGNFTKEARSLPPNASRAVVLERMLTRGAG